MLAPFVTLAPDATRATDQILALFVTSPYLTQYNTEVGVGATVGGLGLIALVVGVVTLATVPSERDVDAAARASRGPDLRFSVGPSSFTLLGSF